MKSNHRMNLRTAALTVGIMLSPVPFPSILAAQSQTQNPNAQKDQEKTQSFLGKIVKLKNGQYALLTDEQAGKGLFLDDQEKAKQFEGQNVKVTGVLESAKGLVHVANIDPA